MSATLYLLDANVLINAKNFYYAFDQVPEFWEWLVDQGVRGKVKIPLEVFEEITGGNDELSLWAGRADVKTALLLDEDVDIALVREVTINGYAADLSDVEQDQVGADPFIVAHARKGVGRAVVTSEVSKPTAQRARRKLPDVCATFGVKCCNPFEFSRALNFRTNWRE